MRSQLKGTNIISNLFLEKKKKVFVWNKKCNLNFYLQLDKKNILKKKYSYYLTLVDKKKINLNIKKKNDFFFLYLKTMFYILKSTIDHKYGKSNLILFKGNTVLYDFFYFFEPRIQIYDGHKLNKMMVSDKYFGYKVGQFFSTRKMENKHKKK